MTSSTFLEKMKNNISLISYVDTVEDGQSDNKRSTTLIFSLCVFTVVVIASLGLVIKWIYNKHKKDQDLSIPGNTSLLSNIW